MAQRIFPEPPRYDTEWTGGFKADVDGSREAVVETLEHHVSHAAQNGRGPHVREFRPSLRTADVFPVREPF